MARSINNGTGEIQIGTGGILEYPTNAYLRRSFYVPLSRAQLVALLVPRSTITRLRTDERVCATATVSTPFSPSTKPLFPRMKYVRRGRGPTASRDNSELCLSSSGNRPLFPTESRAFSPLLSFVNLRGVLSPLLVSGVTHSSRSTVHTHTETILRFETLVVVSKNAPRRSSIHHLLPSLSSLPILRFNGRNIFGNS